MELVLCRTERSLLLLFSAKVAELVCTMAWCFFGGEIYIVDYLSILKKLTNIFFLNHIFNFRYFYSEKLVGCRLGGTVVNKELDES